MAEKLRIAYDSSTAKDVPAGGDLYLGYIDGNYVTVPTLRGRFPHAKVVGITVNGSSLDAEMADVESGNLSAAGGAMWAKKKVARGQHPTLYFPSSMKREIYRALRTVGLRPRKDVSLFIAQYDGIGKIPRWAVGKQAWHGDKGHPGAYSGGHFDKSVVRPYWRGVDPAQNTDLGTRSTYLASRLAGRLTKRKNPVGKGRHLLEHLHGQIGRVLNLGGNK